MSLDAISAAIADLVRGVTATTGGDVVTVNKVEEELPEGTDELKGVDLRQDENRVHFWRVYVGIDKGMGYAGGIEPRYAIKVRGHYGVARDNPADGVQSDNAFRVIADAVFKKLQAPANRNPGGCIYTDDPVPGPIVDRKVRVGSKIPLCHTFEITYFAQEEST